VPQSAKNSSLRAQKDLSFELEPKKNKVLELLEDTNLSILNEIEAAINKSEWVLESLVYELKGKVVARVEINNEEFQKQFAHLKGKTTEMEKAVNDILTNIRKSVNDEVNKFSKLTNIFEQKEPFVKTPTKKIKRYLYKDKDANENPKDNN